MKWASRNSRRARPGVTRAATLILLFAWAAIFSISTAAKSLKKIATIQLPGPLGKPFDALTIDSQNHWLFCTHTGVNALYVIDLENYKLTQTVTGLPGVRSVVYIPELKRIFASVSGEDSIDVIDASTFEVTKKIPTEAAPAAMAFAAPQGYLFVSDELARAVVVLDAAREAPVRILRFDSRTGTLQYDSVTQKVYVNLPDTHQLAVIDPETASIIASYPVGKCMGNSGMALDTQRQLAFLSCEGNNLLTIFDLRTHQPLNYLPMAAGGAGVALDPKLGRIYVACASGAISVYEEKDSQKCRKLSNFSAAYAVHTLAVDEKTQRVYVPEQEEDGMPVSQLVVYQEQP
jgi:DNA-binding beta-propeller fold protein YncE